jgi:hypothetical protein
MKKIPQIAYYLAAAALLTGYICFFERGAVKTDADKDKKTKIFEDYVADDINKIEVENLSTTVNTLKAPIILGKDDKDAWQITAPHNFKADQDAVHTVLNTFSNFNPESTIEKPADLAEFGLNTPSARCSMTNKMGKNYVLLIGDKSITGASAYVKTPDNASVYMLPQFSVSNLIKDVNSYRDKSFFKADDILANEIKIVRDGKATVFEKNKDGNWNIIQPIKVKADDQKINSFFSSINNLRISDYVDDNPSNPAIYGFSKPHASVEIGSADGKENHEILLGRKKMKSNVYYVKLGDEPNVYLTEGSIDKTLDIKLGDFRDKSMMKFDSAQANTLTVKHNNRSYVYKKDDKGQWSSEGRMKAQDEAVNIITVLSNTDIVDFASKKDSTGLADPDYVVEVLLGSGTQRIYRFGNRQKGNVYVALNNTKEAYTAPAALLSQMDDYYSAIMTPVVISSPATK